MFDKTPEAFWGERQGRSIRRPSGQGRKQAKACFRQSHPLRQPSLFELRLAYASKPVERDQGEAALRSLGEGGPLKGNGMYYVYLLRSKVFPDRRYIGYHAFANERRAREFEHYLKSGSGKAFANRRLW